MRIINSISAVVIIVGLAAACGRGEVRGPNSAATTVSGARIASNDDAVARITAARCTREVACNNVGPGKTYASRERCDAELGHNERADLRGGECPGGISAPDLDDCLADIASEKCGNPIDAISRLAACRKAKLCLAR